HHRGELIERELGDGGALGVRLTYSREPAILGTGGGIRRLYEFLTDGGHEPFLVVNGKILIDVDLHALLERHVSVGAAATMVLRETPDAARWGAIEVGAGGRVTKILDHGAAGERVCMFTGVHALSPRFVLRLPADRESDSIRQAYLPALAAGERIEGVVTSGYFHEHSTPERYLEGNVNALRGRATVRHLPGPLTGVAPSAEVHPSVELIAPYRISDGARIDAGACIGPDVVVGARARIGEGAHLERAVVWPASTVTGNIRDSIVTPRGVQLVA